MTARPIRQEGESDRDFLVRVNAYSRQLERELEVMRSLTIEMRKLRQRMDTLKDILCPIIREVEEDEGNKEEIE